MTLTIVPVTVDHPLLDRVAAMFDDYRVHYGLPSAPSSTTSWLRDQVARQRLSAAAALHGDQVCGFVTAAIMPASLRLSTAWLVRDLYVAPPHRRTGIASALLHHVIDSARAAGALRVSITTETDNDAALALYTAAGFTPVAGLESLTLALDPDPTTTAATYSLGVRPGITLDQARHLAADLEDDETLQQLERRA